MHQSKLFFLTKKENFDFFQQITITLQHLPPKAHESLHFFTNQTTPAVTVKISRQSNRETVTSKYF